MSNVQMPQNNTDAIVYSNQNPVTDPEQVEIEKYKYSKNNFQRELNCINVAEHTSECIVCSKIYRDDSTIYIFIIIFLLIIVIILLKNLFSIKSV